jgi:hypothetical protein
MEADLRGQLSVCAKRGAGTHETVITVTTVTARQRRARRVGVCAQRLRVLQPLQ